MAGGGQTQSISRQEIDPDLKNAQFTLLGDARRFLNQRGYQAFPGPLVAGFNPLQRAAHQYLTNAILPGVGGLGYQPPDVSGFGSSAFHFSGPGPNARPGTGENTGTNNRPPGHNPNNPGDVDRNGDGVVDYDDQADWDPMRSQMGVMQGFDLDLLSQGLAGRGVSVQRGPNGTVQLMRDGRVVQDLDPTNPRGFEGLDSIYRSVGGTPPPRPDDFNALQSPSGGQAYTGPRVNAQAGPERALGRLRFNMGRPRTFDDVSQEPVLDGDPYSPPTQPPTTQPPTSDPWTPPRYDPPDEIDGTPFVDDPWDHGGSAGSPTDVYTPTGPVPYGGSDFYNPQPTDPAVSHGYGGFMGDGAVRGRFSLLDDAQVDVPIGAAPGVGLGEIAGAAQQANQQATNPVDINPFFNPYQNEVIDNTVGDLNRARQILNQESSSLATRSGAFGGSRHGVIEAENNRGFLDSVGRFSSQLRNQGFNTAAGLAQQDAARRLGATGLYGQLGGALQSGTFRAGDVLSRMGAQQQGLSQGMIDAYRGQFREARDFPLMGFGLQQGILQGMPVGMTQSLIQPHNRGQGFAQGALGGAGMGSMFGPWGAAIGGGVGGLLGLF